MSEKAGARVEMTLVVLYDDVRQDTNKIVAHFLQGGFHVVHRKAMERMPEEGAVILCHQLKELPSHDATVKLLTTSPCEVFVLSKIDAINALNELIGPRDPFIARREAPTSLRALYGTDEVKNAARGSRNFKEANEEIEYFFPSPGQGTKDWVLRQLMPTVTEGLSQLAIARPADAYTWLASWIEKHRPLPAEEAEAYSESVLEECCLKSDRFEGIGKLAESNDPDLSSNGASKSEDSEALLYWNYRKCFGVAPVYGMGQSTKEGIQDILMHVGGIGGYDRIVCLNMREEPVVFLDGLPCAPRINGHLNDNILHLGGIDGAEIAAMEEKLRREVLEEAFPDFSSATESSSNNTPDTPQTGAQLPKVVVSPQVYHQKRDMSNYIKRLDWNESLGTAETLEDVYAQISKQSKIPVFYHRIPITDENAPTIEAFDAIVDIMRENLPYYPAFVTNCQMGRGRTTTAMVCLCLYWRIRGQLALPKADADVTDEGDGETDLPVLRRSVSTLVHTEAKRDLRNAEFLTILRLIQMLPHGILVKRHLDAAIDEAGAFHNLRTSIYDAKEQAENILASKSPGGEGRDHNFWLNRSLNYLQRYYWLLVFTAYLLEHTEMGFPLSFEGYVRKNWMLIGPVAYASLE